MSVASPQRVIPLWQRILRRVLVFVLILVAAWWTLGCCVQRQILFPRHIIGAPSPQAFARLEGAEQLWLDTPDGKVEAWFIPGDGVSPQRPGPAVLFSHGNAELIDFAAPDLQPYRRMGVSVLLLEFRGYGRSAGAPSQRALVDDGIKAFDLLAARPDVDAKRIVLHGRSIGAGVSCGVAAQRPPAAMTLQSAFTSVTRMAWGYLIPSFVVLDPFHNDRVVAELDCLILLFHGTRDTIVPYRHGQDLAKAGKRARLVSYDCGHNDLPPDEAAYWLEIQHHLLESGVLANPQGAGESGHR